LNPNSRNKAETPIKKEKPVKRKQPTESDGAAGTSKRVRLAEPIFEQPSTSDLSLESQASMREIGLKAYQTLRNAIADAIKDTEQEVAELRAAARKVHDGPVTRQQSKGKGKVKERV
jgi:hypothetical protein